MSDRNWDAELAKIDQQLASVSDEALLAERTAASAPGGRPAGGAAPTRLPPREAPSRAAVPAAAVAEKRWVGWFKVALAIAAAAGLMVWPWPAACGAPLIGFTAAAGGVAVLGVWSAVSTWRHRLGLAHVASLLVVVWGLVLGAREVLPRVGYAAPTAARGPGWNCPAPVVGPVALPR